ncbi:hypothetical protein Avbf_11377 [Armadillidium vulgare]|nr:hypothetical protein Avbf_11377 [Armadillidium vulgare]
MTSVDKYLIVEGRQSKKHKKHKKNKKHHQASSSDEDVPDTLLVNRDIGEMPEGASVSDEEDVDTRPLDDPHRALDIDLDMPLSPTEKIPTRSHRESSNINNKVPIEENILTSNIKTDIEKKSKKKTKGKKESKLTKEKRKRSKNLSNLELLLLEDNNNGLQQENGDSVHPPVEEIIEEKG